MSGATRRSAFILAACLALAACGSANTATQAPEVADSDTVFEERAAFDDVDQTTTATATPESLTYTDELTEELSQLSTSNRSSDETGPADDQVSTGDQTSTSTIAPTGQTTTSATPTTTADPVTTTTSPPPTTAAPTTTSAAPPTAPPTTSRPPVANPGADRTVGTGTPASCTSAAVVAAVAAGGVITFDCGANPVTIAMEETAKVINSNGPEIVIDGGGLVTLDGQNRHRILYMNTCDQAQVWTTPHCNNQDHPRLTVQNLTLVNGNATGSHDQNGGGGAIFSRGGQLTVTNTTFDSNRCTSTGPDVGGAAIRAFDQYDDQPIVVRASTFRNGVCSNGGAISSIGVSWLIIDSVFANNQAIGNGANPAQPGTPGGGSGGAIYLDGNLFTLDLRNSQITGNPANEGGGAIFFVSNNRTGSLIISDSTLQNNPSAGFETRGLPGIFYLGNGDPSISNSTLE